MKIPYLIALLLFVNLAYSQTFEEIDQGVFAGAQYPSIAVANIDSELNDTQEIIIIGNGNSGWRANLYAQDTNGNYTNIEGTFLDAINSQSKVIFGDIDGDGDDDLLITSNETKLYRNIGLGIYNEIASPIANVTQGAIAFFDIDNDNDLDLLVTGYDQDTSNDVLTVLYTNDGTGSFIEVAGTPFLNVTNSTISYADIDNDNDVDILITGTKFNSNKTTNLFINDGNGNFTEVVNTPFENVGLGSSAFADIDDDGDQDLYITGRDWQDQAFGKVYINVGAGVFVGDSNSGLPPVHNSAIAFGDVDGDNDLDVIVTGLGPETFGLFTNDGSGNFTQVAGVPFDQFVRSAVAFKDFDNDNDLDILIAGFSGDDNTYRTKLYRNTTVLGVTSFTEVSKSIVYPNPVQDTFTLQLPEEYINTSASIEFVLYDSIGRKVFVASSFSSEGNQINIQNIKSGVYFYELFTSHKKISSGKLIKR